MVYFNQRAATPRTAAEAEQWQRVLAFRERFPQEGLWWPYRGKTNFERKVRQHLTRFLQDTVFREATAAGTPRAAAPRGGRTTARLKGSGAMAQGRGATAAGQGGVAVGGNMQGNIVVAGSQTTVHVHAADPAQSGDAVRQRYLVHLHRFCQALPLASLGADPSAEQDLTLDDVYIDLHTTTAVQQTTGQRRRASALETDAHPLTAMEAFAQCPRLVLLGDPGSGKSTFVRKILAWVAAAHLDKVSMPPGCTADLLPVLITLRDLAPALAVLGALGLDILSEARRRRVLVETVRNWVVTDLERYEASEFRDAMRDALSGGRCLLVLDGLEHLTPCGRTVLVDRRYDVITMGTAQDNKRIPRALRGCRLPSA